MRIAYSALAATSGLVLLGLAFFGRPDAYLRPALRQLDAWGQPATSDAPADRPAPAVTPSPAPVAGPVPQAAPGRQGVDAGELASKVAALQSQVTRLQEQLKAAQVQASARPVPPPASAAQPAPQPAAPQPAMTEHPAPPPAAQAPSAAQAEAAPPRQQVVNVPERREVVKAAPTPPRVRSEAPQPRPDADELQSVMARLRQQPAPPPQPSPQPAPQTSPPQQAAPAPQPPPTAVSFALRQSLLAARAALQNGQIDQGVRTLQEVQLRLVFRPTTPDAPDPGFAGPAAADVAHALDAVGVRDIGTAQQYIGRAMASLSGGGSVSPEDRSRAPEWSPYSLR